MTGPDLLAVDDAGDEWKRGAGHARPITWGHDGPPPIALNPAPVAVRDRAPSTDPTDARQGPGDFLVYDGESWLGARWEKRDRELGWRFFDRDGRVVRPTHWLPRPGPIVGAFGPADRLDRALPSGLGVSAAGTLLCEGDRSRLVAELLARRRAAEGAGVSGWGGGADEHRASNGEGGGR